MQKFKHKSQIYKNVFQDQLINIVLNLGQILYSEKVRVLNLHISNHALWQR